MKKQNSSTNQGTNTSNVSQSSVSENRQQDTPQARQERIQQKYQLVFNKDRKSTRLNSSHLA